MIRHKSALNVVRIWGKYVGLGSHDRFAQVASMSWDVHIIEVYGTMSVGATSVTCPDMIKKSGPDMQVWLKDREITGMSVVPSHLRTMAGGGADVSRSSAGLPHLRILDVGGGAGCRCGVHLGPWTSPLQQLRALGDLSGLHRCLREPGRRDHHRRRAAHLHLLHLGS